MRLTDWKPGDKLAASHWQESIDALRPLLEQQRGGANSFLANLLPSLFRPSNNAFPRLCVVTNAGPGHAIGGGVDFTDARYWIKWAVPFVETRCGEADAIRIREEEPDVPEESFDQSEAYPAVATNLAELEYNTHLLPTDESVYAWAIPVWDMQEDPQRHWLIDSKPPIEWGVASSNYDWDSGGSTISLTPCRGRTDPTATGASAITCYLAHSAHSNAKRPLPPVLIESGDIIPFVRTNESNGIALPVGCRLTSTVSVGSADSTTEAAQTDGQGDLYKKRVTDTRLVRSVYNTSGTEVLYDYYRTYTYDCGILTDISNETRVTLATPVECP